MAEGGAPGAACRSNASHARANRVCATAQVLAPDPVATFESEIDDIAPAPEGPHSAITITRRTDPSAYSSADPRWVLIWNRETGAKREIADDEDRPFSVRWSPDGRKLALTTARGERGSARGVVRVVDASSGQVVAETDPALDVSLVRWQDQGLLLSKGPSALLGGSGRKDFRWQGGNDTPVELAASPTFTPRGGRVTVSVTDGVLWVAPKAGAAAKRFAGKTRADSDAILDLADGRLDFVGSRWLVLRSDETYVLDLETLKLRPLCLRKGVSFRESSPDGSRLLFVADDARHGFVGKAPP